MYNWAHFTEKSPDRRQHQQSSSNAIALMTSRCQWSISGHPNWAISSICSAKPLLHLTSGSSLFYISLYPTVLLLLILLCCFILASSINAVPQSWVLDPFVYTNSQGVLIWVHGFKCNLHAAIKYPSWNSRRVYSAAHLTSLPRYLVGISCPQMSFRFPPNSALSKDILQ